MLHRQLSPASVPERILKKRRLIKERFYAVLQKAPEPIFFEQIRSAAAGGNDLFQEKIQINFGEGVEILSEMQGLNSEYRVCRHPLPGTGGRRCRYSLAKGEGLCPQAIQ